MGSILNPDNFDFRNKSLLKTPKFFVDKTEFIAHLNSNMQTDDKFICFTRPRRFGKTITAKMLSAYYSKGCDSKELFDRFKIASDAVMKLLYLRITELYKKWKDHPIANWAMIRNQLAMNDKIQSRIIKYESY
ncbi:MAG: AAA family ATPase [Succinivibrionaceae bacterium]